MARTRVIATAAVALAAATEGIPFAVGESFQFRDERYRRLILDPGSGAPARRGH